LVLLAILFVWSVDEPEADVAPDAAVAANTPPEIQSLELVVAPADIVARPTGRDADGDRFHFRYRWSVAGRPQPTRGALLKRNRVRPGETVEVEATPVDRRGAVGRPMRSSLSMEASP